MPELSELTEADVLALEAGPETDALVAVAVMGWREGHEVGEFRRGAVGRVQLITKTFKATRFRFFEPSVSIADAYEALEVFACGDEDRTWEVIRDAGPSFTVQLYYDCRMMETAEAESMSLAASRALLLWAKRRAEA